MDEVPHYWEAHVLEALLEPETQKLLPKVMAAETAIFNRCQQLAGARDHDQERVSLETATHALFMVKARKLGYPSDFRNRETTQNELRYEKRRIRSQTGMAGDDQTPE